jgi:hypothetical protein
MVYEDNATSGKIYMQPTPCQTTGHNYCLADRPLTRVEQIPMSELEIEEARIGRKLYLKKKDVTTYTFCCSKCGHIFEHKQERVYS